MDPGFFDGVDHLVELTPARGKKLNEAARQRWSVDTHRNTLGQAKTFLAWCVEEGWLRKNPLEGVKDVGKRKRGKPQLRLDEARELSDHCRSRAESDPAALGVLIALYLGLRASEVVGLRARDLDDEGRLLWIGEAKTEAGRRVLEVPEVLRPLLLARVRAVGKDRRALRAHPTTK